MCNNPPIDHQQTKKIGMKYVQHGQEGLLYTPQVIPYEMGMEWMESIK